MPFQIITRGDSREIIAWLERYIGPCVSDHGPKMWQGQGWTVNSIGLAKANRNRKLGIGTSARMVLKYSIRIDEHDGAMLCALRWEF